MFSFNSFAEEAKPLIEQETPEQKSEDELLNNEDVIRVQRYLNTMTNVVSDFIQISPDGDITNGKFYLSRPGKLRWQYEPPVKIVIVGNGNNLSYYDFELDQISHVNINSTLAGFLTRERIEFTGDVKIVDFTKESNVLSVKLALRKSPEEGSLTLVLGDNPIVLRKIITSDINGKPTEVTFNNPVFGTEIEDKVFVLPNPRIFKRND